MKPTAFAIHGAAFPILRGSLSFVSLRAGAAATSQPARNWLFRHLILPLYVRLKPDAVANQETRGMIFGYVRVHPGDSYSDIKSNLKLSSGALTYHLDGAAARSCALRRVAWIPTSSSVRSGRWSATEPL